MREDLRLAMLTLAVAGAVFAGNMCAQGATQKPGLTFPDTNRIFAACLPEGISVDEAVSAPAPALGAVAATVTVAETLSRLKAHCSNSKLVDGGGREIRFHRLIGCWGNPPDDYLEQQARQSLEIQQLKKKYTVVKIPCAIDPKRIG